MINCTKQSLSQFVRGWTTHEQQLAAEMIYDLLSKGAVGREKEKMDVTILALTRYYALGV